MGTEFILIISPPVTQCTATHEYAAVIESASAKHTRAERTRSRTETEFHPSQF